ncbi:MAG TPA: sigma factor [Gemmatimonadales bacterium]|nr:sigma factor [Gemmatimonadales bacterium]
MTWTGASWRGFDRHLAEEASSGTRLASPRSATTSRRSAALVVEPWLSKLAQGDTQAAWDLFDARYKRLILATIKRLVPDRDDALDVFGTVCQALWADDCARLRRYVGHSVRRASVATWLVAVVRNLTVDWLRKRDGRRRRDVPPTLSPLQHQIFDAVCLDGASPAEAFEMISTRSGLAMPFHEFLRHVRATLRTVPCHQLAAARSRRPAIQVIDLAVSVPDPAECAEAARRVADVLATQPPDVRRAVTLFVVEHVSAADVARAVGWPDAKAVYNRVYRALAAIRSGLEQRGIGPGDLL